MTRSRKSVIKVSQYRKPHSDMFYISDYETTQFAEEYYKNLSPVFTFMRVWGILPFHKNKQGVTCFKITSWIMVYSLLLYVLFLSLFVLLVCWYVRVRPFQDFDGFTEKILSAGAVITVAIPGFITILFWFSVNQFVKFGPVWLEFQNAFHEVTRKKLALNRRWKYSKLVIFVAVFETVIAIVMNADEFSEEAFSWETFAHIGVWLYAKVYRDLITLFWYVNCKVIVIAAEETLRCFKQDVISHTTPFHVVSEYCVLWVKLSKLVQKFGELTSGIYCFFILLMFGHLAMLTYSVAICVTYKAGKLETTLVTMVVLFECITLSSFLFILCNYGSLATYKVGQVFEEELVSDWKRNMGVKVKEEVNMFLKTMEHCPPKICLKGYIVVNRQLFVTLGSTLVTYLVVLLQFHQNSGNDGRDGSNIQTNHTGDLNQHSNS